MKQIFFYILLISLFSCKNKNNLERQQYWDGVKQTVLQGADMQYIKNPDMITIDATSEEKISTEVFEQKLKCKYIGLKGDNVYGDIRNIIFHNDKIYILDATQTNKIFVWDTQGEFLFHIGNIGQGPGEYSQIKNISIDKKQNVLFAKDGSKPEFYNYNLDNGEIVSTGKYSAGMNAQILDDKIVFHNYFGQFSNDKDANFQIILTDREGMVLYKGLKFEPLQMDAVFSYNALKMNNEELLFTPVLSDTVYTIFSNGTYTSKYYVKHAKSIWEKHSEKLRISDKSKAIISGGYTALSYDFFESDTFICFGIRSQFEKKHITSKIKYYDKESGKVFSLKRDEQRPMKLIKNIQGNVNGVYGKYFIGEISSDMLYHIRDLVSQQELTIENEELLALIKNEDVNTIITLHYFE